MSFINSSFKVVCSSTLSLKAFQSLYTLDKLDMGERDTIIGEGIPQTADHGLKNTMHSRSSQTQKPYIQEINEDIRQTHKTYHFQNCGTVYMDSFNARGVRMENCGNNVPQVTCTLSSSSHLCFSSNFKLAILDHRPKIISNERVLHSQTHAVSSGM